MLTKDQLLASLSFTPLGEHLNTQCTEALCGYLNFQLNFLILKK
jgi:hypothetical protein